MCARRRRRRSVIALRGSRRRVRILPVGRLTRRLLRCVGAVLIGAALLLLLLRGRQIRRSRRSVHWGVPRSSPRACVVWVSRQILGVAVGVAGRTAVLLRVVRIGVLQHIYVSVQITTVVVSHIRCLRATAGRGGGERKIGDVAMWGLTGGVGYSMPGRRSGEGGGRQVGRLTLHGCLPVAVHRAE